MPPDLLQRGAFARRESLGIRDRLRWRLNRLRCMTPAEISHRTLRSLSMHAERAGLLAREPVPPPELVPAPRPWIHASARVDAARYLAAADRIAAGRLDIFALRDAGLGSPPRWNRDPKTGLEAPLIYGKLLDYRDPGLVGDIKYLWEPSRHMHLVTLAQAFALSGDVRYSGIIQQHLESWIDACPYRLGPHWASSLEAAVRLINWSVTWQLIGGARSPLFDNDRGARFRHRWLEAVYQHAQFVRSHFSLYSSANNHLIGEATGLFIAALTWPHWPRMRAWLPQAKAILERESLLQNAPDGVNREQAASYHQVTLDFLLLALMAGKANGHWFSVSYESRLEAMLEYLASIIDVGGNVPMFGDSDDGLIVRLAQDEGFCRYRSLLATGAILFWNDDFRAKAGELDDKTRWLVGGEADVAFHERSGGPTRLPVRQAFPQGGYYILGCDFETPGEIRLIADAGPLGYQTIAAHGHADALSFTLSVAGREFLIDPGTYAYHTNSLWRQYFRGTSAHNTVRLDREDQSQSGGNFMWLRKARAGCSFWSSDQNHDLFQGWHDGYMALADPVMHRRRIGLVKAARHIVIDDILEMSSEHLVEIFFHCHEECSITQTADGYTLRRGSVALALRLPRLAQAASEVVRGSESPILGWVSRRFDEKQPAPTIVWRACITGHAVVRSEIIVQG
jgi:hypothetical protein